MSVNATLSLELSGISLLRAEFFFHVSLSAIFSAFFFSFCFMCDSRFFLSKWGPLFAEGGCGTAFLSGVGALPWQVRRGSFLSFPFSGSLLNILVQVKI